MKKLLYVLLVAFVTLVQAKPFPETGWPPVTGMAPEPTTKMWVRWVRVEGVPQAEFRDGVCVLYMSEREDDSYVAERLVDAHCVGKPMTVQGRPSKAVLVYWHRVSDSVAVSDLYERLFYATKRRAVAGFYWHPDINGPCHVVTARTDSAFQHELRHCFDGAFHSGGEVRVIRPTFMIPR